MDGFRYWLYLYVLIYSIAEVTDLDPIHRGLVPKTGDRTKWNVPADEIHPSQRQLRSYLFIATQ
jgi:hypothetical protein